MGETRTELVQRIPPAPIKPESGLNPAVKMSPWLWLKRKGDEQGFIAGLLVLVLYFSYTQVEDIRQNNRDMNKERVEQARELGRLIEKVSNQVDGCQRVIEKGIDQSAKTERTLDRFIYVMERKTGAVADKKAPVFE